MNPTQSHAWKTGRVLLQRLFGSLRRKLRKGAEPVHEFDRKYGTDTSGIVEAGVLDIPIQRAAHAVRYQTAIVEVYQELLGALPIDPRDYVFVDLGCGKGRALLLASMLPFKEIIGVELSPSLHAIAERNIALFKDPEQKCRNIRAVCEDAARFQWPNENLVIYLFNPFDEEVLEAVLRSVRVPTKLERQRIVVAYLKPVHGSIIEANKAFRIMVQTSRYKIYQSTPL